MPVRGQGCTPIRAFQTLVLQAALGESLRESGSRACGVRPRGAGNPPVPIQEPAVKSTRGNHRALTDVQVQTILTWHEELEDWNGKRAKVPTLKVFARANHMDASTLLRLLPKLDRKIDLLLRIRAWRCAERELLAARAKIETLRGMARAFGVSDNTIASAVRRKGAYKQASREVIDNVRLQRRVRLDRLRRMNLY